MLMTVLAAGTVALLIPALVMDGWKTMGRPATVPAFASGVAYVAGSGELYQALSRTPVKIVAPVLGSFPILCLGIAAGQGRAVTTVEWLAVLAIVFGIAMLTLTGRERGTPTRGSLGAALGWAAVGAAGFAATVTLGQEAARQGAEVPAMVVTRVTALAEVLLLRAIFRSIRPVPGIGPVLLGMGVLDEMAFGLVTASAGLPNPECAAVAWALVGVLTILLARKVLGKRVAALQRVGLATVFAGIAVLSLHG